MTTLATLARRTLLGAAALPLLPLPARAQAAPLRIGVLSDFSGPYRDTGGQTALACARQAVQDFDAAGKGLAVEILSADHQQKADVGMSIVRRWFDQDGVDVIIEVNNSAIALAVAGLVRDKDRIHLNTGAATSDLSGPACNANMIHWGIDSWCRAHAVVDSLVKSGMRRWYFITADYAFGHNIEKDATAQIMRSGGEVVGHSVYPFPSNGDFSSFLLSAAGAKANVIALAMTGDDLRNTMKQAQEFGVTGQGITMASMGGYLNDVRAMGLDAAQGMRMTELFYWDLNEQTRGFLQRIKPKAPDNWPNSEHASAYSAVLHYLKTAAAMGPAAAKRSGAETVAAMKRMPTDDDCFGPGRIREDGRKLAPAHLFGVKPPAESRSSWDCFKLVHTIPAEEAFRPMAEGGCPLVATK